MRLKKTVKILLASIVLGVSTIGINGVQAQNSQEPDLYINNSIQGSEKKIMEDVISTLPIEDRENVIYITKGGDIYANKPELKDDIEELTSVKDNVYKNSIGEQFIFPKSDPKPSVVKNTYFSVSKVAAPNCSNGGTGPYRRVYSSTGYSWLSMKVHIPSETEIKDLGPGTSTGDTGYIYTGGWGGDKSLTVDAGMQHNTLKKNWSGAIRVSGNSAPFDMTNRYQPNQDVQMKFYVNANNSVTLVITGILIDGIKKTQTVVAEAQGFTLDGSNNILKRITSIGQTKGKENFATGSYMNNIHWYDVNIGKSSINNTPWNSGSQSGGLCSYPNNTKVKTSYTNQGEETVSIDL
ncbi:hypothetical protein PQ460_20155 [Paenibacillus sp. KACC 21273]|uniref:hypothetical protein n=1 Tax=Paenibacillus sp. KACC 21273 TaxID=3025665 RepID=UPI00236547F0|nr:hypothetical protein [Paenibacillus sp. KACC 21273]WDF50273.1 hypothetical protein PQ460_20155 [Paenibacillus sp. KACC 21273]